jgi:hypothetical protein
MLQESCRVYMPKLVGLRTIMKEEFGNIQTVHTGSKFTLK